MKNFHVIVYPHVPSCYEVARTVVKCRNPSIPSSSWLYRNLGHGDTLTMDGLSYSPPLSTMFRFLNGEDKEMSGLSTVWIVLDQSVLRKRKHFVLFVRTTHVF